MGSIEQVEIGVIGGGAIGLTIALELAEAGRSVRVFESARFVTGTSHGNAGLLCPSYATPMASPQALFEGLASLVHGGGAFTLAKPLWHRETAAWIGRFLRACSPTQVKCATELGIELAQRGIVWHERFSLQAREYGFAKTGWLYVYQTRHGFEEGLRHARAVGVAGVESQMLEAAEAVAFEPSLSPPAGAIHYPGDAHLDPHAYVAAAAECATRAGVELHEASEVTGIAQDASGGLVRITTVRDETLARYVIIAAGSRTPQLAHKLGASLPIVSGRGYSASLSSGQLPKRPLMFAEAHIVVSPTRDRVRMTSGMDLGSDDPTPPREGIRAMCSGAARYFAHPDVTVTDEWAGFRPMTPDSLPVIGRLRSNPRVIVAAGHGTLGMTLAPATAQIVRGLFAGIAEPALLSPRRFGC